MQQRNTEKVVKLCRIELRLSAASAGIIHGSTNDCESCISRGQGCSKAVQIVCHSRFRN